MEFQKKTKSVVSCAVFPSNLKVWTGNDDPTKGSNFIMTENPIRPLRGNFWETPQKSSENSTVVLFSFGVSLEYLS